VSPATAAVFDALGDSTRRAMVSLLARGPLTISALAEPLGVTRTAVGQHLHVLEAAGLVASRKRGRARYCGIRPEGLDLIATWSRECRREWEARLDRLGAVLDELGDPSP
jgi:DNA-binding transcriptional ArsR family regulator